MCETKSEIEITFTPARHRTEVRATINYLVYTSLHIRSQLLTLSHVDKFHVAFMSVAALLSKVQLSRSPSACYALLRA